MTHTACAELRFKQLWPFYLAQSDSIYSSLISRVVAIKSPFTLGKGSVLFWKLTNWFKVLVELPSWAMTKWLADEDRKDNISSLCWLANLLFFDCLVCSPQFIRSYIFFCLIFSSPLITTYKVSRRPSFPSHFHAEDFSLNTHMAFLSTLNLLFLGKI